MSLEGRRIEVRGTVQGVGYRPWVYRIAREQGLSGRVRNDSRGVTIEAFGSAAALAAFLRRIETDRPPAAEVHSVRTSRRSTRHAFAPRLDPCREVSDLTGIVKPEASPCSPSAPGRRGVRSRAEAL